LSEGSVNGAATKFHNFTSEDNSTGQQNSGKNDFIPRGLWGKRVFLFFLPFSCASAIWSMKLRFFLRGSEKLRNCGFYLKKSRPRPGNNYSSRLRPTKQLLAHGYRRRAAPMGDFVRSFQKLLIRQICFVAARERKPASLQKRGILSKFG